MYIKASTHATQRVNALDEIVLSESSAIRPVTSETSHFPREAGLETSHKNLQQLIIKIGI